MHILFSNKKCAFEKNFWWKEKRLTYSIFLVAKTPSLKMQIKFKDLVMVHTAFQVSGIFRILLLSRLDIVLAMKAKIRYMSQM